MVFNHWSIDWDCIVIDFIGMGGIKEGWTSIQFRIQVKATFRLDEINNLKNDQKVDEPVSLGNQKRIKLLPDPKSLYCELRGICRGACPHRVHHKFGANLEYHDPCIWIDKEAWIHKTRTSFDKNLDWRTKKSYGSAWQRWVLTGMDCAYHQIADCAWSVGICRSWCAH